MFNVLKLYFAFVFVFVCHCGYTGSSTFVVVVGGCSFGHLLCCTVGLFYEVDHGSCLVINRITVVMVVGGL